ncbi:Uncharacterized protein Adt_17864 [Abeliophyllum distichum]|uniref:Uncharacterized protein n=1 Tax=Abeliophyllum distichum TaxID=126358 RepID=A0ABD1THQ0_9LAMI
MTDRVLQSYNDTEGKSRQSMQSYQSVWMAHWTRARSNTMAEPHNLITNLFGDEEIHPDSKKNHSVTGLEIASDISRLANQSLRMSSNNMRNERSGSKIFALDGPCRNGGSSFASQHPPEADDMQSLMPQIGYDYAGSTSHIEPYKVDNEKRGFDNKQKAISLFSDRSALVSNKLLPNANLRVLEQQHCNNNIHSGFFLSEREMDGQSDPGKFINASLRKSNASLLLDVPSTSHNHLSAFDKEWFQKMQNHSGVKLFPRTTRICTAVDSVEGVSGDCPRYSQTTHSSLIAKQNDVDMRERSRKSGVFIKSNRNTSGDLHSVYPFVSQGQTRLKLQSLGSSTDSEEKGDLEDVNASKIVIKHDLSAETDTMAMDPFEQKNELSDMCLNSTLSNKVIYTDSNLPLRINVTPSKVGLNTPDINLECPALPAAASSSNDAEPSSSRTQSLDMDVLLAHAEQLSTSKHVICSDDDLKTDPTTRWVKRLKVSASDSYACGTKSSSFGKNPSHEKEKKLFGRILIDGITSSEPAVDKQCEKLLTISDKIGDLPRKDESSFMDVSKEGKKLLLSHSWIQRWLHKGSGSPQKEPEAVVVCEPQCSKLALEDLQKKQFPSVAAMALMGKAMSGFEPCELQMRGSSSMESILHSAFDVMFKSPFTTDAYPVGPLDSSGIVFALNRSMADGAGERAWRLSAGDLVGGAGGLFKDGDGAEAGTAAGGEASGAGVGVAGGGELTGGGVATGGGEAGGGDVTTGGGDETAGGGDDVGGGVVAAGGGEEAEGVGGEAVVVGGVAEGVVGVGGAGVDVGEDPGA